MLAVEEFAKGRVDHTLIRKLVANWPRRTTIRSDKFPWPEPEAYNPETPDYPVRLLPFREHPRFLAAPEHQRREVLTRAWLTYNERTILAEEYMANPAFTMIVHGEFEGADEFHVRQAVQHALIDEHFHTLIHMTAIDETRRLRGLNDQWSAPNSLTRRSLLAEQARATEPWQRALVILAFATVAEISVNAYLELLSADDTIQPMHKLVTYLHNRDEFAHGQLIVEVIKLLYLRMSEPQQTFFIGVLPRALHAYAAHDFSAWRAILHRVGVDGAEDIVAACEHEAASQLLVRDFSGLKQVATELDIVDRLDFRFAA
jgi:hypothetical protein